VVVFSKREVVSANTMPGGGRKGRDSIHEGRNYGTAEVETWRGLDASPLIDPIQRKLVKGGRKQKRESPPEALVEPRLNRNEKDGRKLAQTKSSKAGRDEKSAEIPTWPARSREKKGASQYRPLDEEKPSLPVERGAPSPKKVRDQGRAQKKKERALF